MIKDFDNWNFQKKKIHQLEKNKLYHARQIWWCFLGVNIGFEQDGTGMVNERPILILRGFSKNVCLVVPLTTSKKKNTYHVDIGLVGGKKACAIISQIRLIDTKRLINQITILNKKDFEAIKKAVKDLL